MAIVRARDPMPIECGRATSRAPRLACDESARAADMPAQP
jgi:hypothetical protein